MEKNRAIILDRDGVINKDFGYIASVSKLKFLPNVIKALKILATSGYKLIIITNQSGVGRGYYKESDVKKIHAKMLKKLKENSVKIDAIYYCIHAPEDNCNCRKPGIKLFKKAEKELNLDLKKSYTIGDKTSDIKAGKDAGCKTILVKTGFGGKDKRVKVKPDSVAKDLYEATQLIKKLDELNVNCIVIHGCPSNVEKAMNPKTRTYDKHWIPWIKKELIARGIKTETPLMPVPWEPDYKKFKKEFERYKVTEDTILIGHSCGCAFLVRWLGETKQKINKLILVAPWKIPDKEDKFRRAFYEYPIDETIRSRVKEIIMFTSDNEEDDGKKSLKIFHEALAGKIIELKGRGHYTIKDMGTEEFPELLKVILKKQSFIK